MRSTSEIFAPVSKPAPARVRVVVEGVVTASGTAEGLTFVTPKPVNVSEPAVIVPRSGLVMVKAYVPGVAGAPPVKLVGETLKDNVVPEPPTVTVPVVRDTPVTVFVTKTVAPEAKPVPVMTSASVPDPDVKVANDADVKVGGASTVIAPASGVAVVPLRSVNDKE